MRLFGNSFGIFSAVITITMLSGCALDAVKVGALVLGAPAAREAVTGVFTDSNGEIIAYCCETGCAEAESV